MQVQVLRQVCSFDNPFQLLIDVSAEVEAAWLIREYKFRIFPRPPPDWSRFFACSVLCFFSKSTIYSGKTIRRKLSSVFGFCLIYTPSALTSVCLINIMPVSRFISSQYSADNSPARIPDAISRLIITSNWKSSCFERMSNSSRLCSSFRYAAGAVSWSAILTL